MTGETTPAPGQAASAPSIEGTRAALQRLAFLTAEERRLVMVAADAYAHAVLEEAWVAFWTAADEQTELDALRARIEALGRS